MRKEFRAVLNRLKNAKDDRIVRLVAVLGIVLVALIVVALRPAPRYFLVEVPCRRYSDFAVICPVSPSAPAQFPAENPRKTP
jgi:hypothetical protein